MRPRVHELRALQIAGFDLARQLRKSDLSRGLPSSRGISAHQSGAEGEPDEMRIRSRTNFGFDLVVVVLHRLEAEI